jgi:ABC-type branched-subunit amino acid transport system substrate-binding protein
MSEKRRGTVGLAIAIAVAAALAIVVVVTGCGGGSGSSSGSGGSGGEILLGQIAGTTGAYGTTGIAMVNGGKLAVAKLNEEGGVMGETVKLTNYNDKADPTLSSQLYQRLVSDGAVAVLGSGDTGPATASMAQRLKVVNTGAVDDAGLTIYPNGPEEPPYEWVFSFGLNTYAWGEALGDYALENCSGLAVLHDPSTYGEGGDEGVKLAYEKSGGKELALDETITENWSTGATVSLDSELSKIKSSGADCVVVWLTPQDTARFAQEARNEGAEFKILGNDEINADETFSKLAGSAAKGAVGASITAELEPSPQRKEFEKEYEAQFNETATPFATATYDAVMMLAQVMEEKKSTDSEAIREGLNEVSGFEGLQGTIGFTEQDHATITRKQLTLVEYDGSEWKPLPKQPAGGE